MNSDQAGHSGETPSVKRIDPVPPVIGSALVIACLACGASGSAVQRGTSDWDAERRRMVDEQLRARDIRSARVLNAMLTVPRHLFVPEPQRPLAYSDSP